ncbi:hypothetical protein CDEF62S_03497 [Castellaniella defragrans]
MAAPEQALADYLRQQCEAQSAEVLEFSRLAGGAIQDNHALTVRMSGGSHPGEHHVVVRSDAPSRIAASLDRAQEFHVLEAAYAAGLTVPRPLWLCMDPAVLGRPFFIMQRAEGTSAPRDFLHGALSGRGGARPRAPPGRRAGTPAPGAAAAAASNSHPAECAPRAAPHQTCPAAIHHERTPPGPGLGPGLAGGAGARVSRHGAVPWRLPAAGNYMVHKGHFDAVLDEVAAWSDPYEDLGWLCLQELALRRSGAPMGGLGDRPDLFTSYTSVSGRPVDARRVEYWAAMGLVRWAVIALLHAERHLSGEEPSLELPLPDASCPKWSSTCWRRSDAWNPARRRAHRHDQPTRRRRTARRSPAHPHGTVAAGAAARQGHTARIVARAMGIAARELQQREAAAADATAAIAAFLAQAALANLPAHERTLRRLIREQRRPTPIQKALPDLLMPLTRHKLALSNAKALP